jgi:CheY-like chemotaxis protein
MPRNGNDCGICTLVIAPRDGVAFLDGDQIAHVPCYILDPAGAPLKDPAARDFLRGVHVLIVEDNADALELLKDAFEYSGAFVTTADNATLGKSLLRETVPHVIVSDISMPDDGVALVAEVLAFGRELGSKIPAIAITAVADSVDDVRSAGFAAFIAKPLDPFVLTVVAEKLAREPRTQAQLRRTH